MNQSMNKEPKDLLIAIINKYGSNKKIRESINHLNYCYSIEIINTDEFLTYPKELI